RKWTTYESSSRRRIVGRVQPFVAASRKREVKWWSSRTPTWNWTLRNTPTLIGPIERGVADVVYGSRFLGRSRQGQPFSYYVGNKVLTLASNILTGLKLPDVWTRDKMFRREILQKIHLREDRFGFEPEITAKIARCGCRVSEVAVSYTCRGREEGKKIG